MKMLMVPNMVLYQHKERMWEGAITVSLSANKIIHAKSSDVCGVQSKLRVMSEVLLKLDDHPK